LKEVILSAGVVNTPSILLYSGVGNATFPSSLGITPLHNLPSVGQNMSEHPLAANLWLVNSTNTHESFDRDPVDVAKAEKQWRDSRTGPLAVYALSWIGWFRLPEWAEIFKRYSDPTSGPGTPHYELMITVGAVCYLSPNLLLSGTLTEWRSFPAAS
jgi:choline dehydrogenase-like flavoprotein